MTAQILDGRALATALKGEVADGVARFRAAHGRAPRLDIFLVGDDPGSAIYVRHKEKAAVEVGLDVAVHRVASDVTHAALASLLASSNVDDAVDGALLQLPVPGQLPARELLDAIAPSKDVDALHPQNMGLLALWPRSVGSADPWRGDAAPFRERPRPRWQARRRDREKPNRRKAFGGHAPFRRCDCHHGPYSHAGFAQLCREADVIVAAAGSPESCGALGSGPEPW